MTLRRCLKEPIPEIFQAAVILSKAADASLAGYHQEAKRLFVLANDPNVWAFTEAVWGAGAKARHSFVSIAGAPPFLARPDRPLPRMPTPATQQAALKRDGYHCRFCGVPVISAVTRRLAHGLYPAEVQWGRTNASQHAAFQCMWLQFDHVLPNSRGGTSDLDNIVVTCAPCNFGRMEATLDEALLANPLLSDPPQKWSGWVDWDGLRRLGSLRGYPE